MSDDDEPERPPTHLIRWEAACDVRLRGHGFRIHKTHERRVRQAGWCWTGGLIADRCTFGPRRLTLAGEVPYVPPRYGAVRPAMVGADLAVRVLTWTCRTLYGMDPGPIGYEAEPANLRLAVRVTAY